MAVVAKVVFSILFTYLGLVEGQMYDELFDNVMARYNEQPSRYTIPVSSQSDVVHVNVSLQIAQLTSLNTETGDAEMYGWLGLEWRDRRLRWKSSRNNNINRLHIPADKIWKPDIVLFNGRTESEEYDAIVERDGAVKFYPKITIKTRCMSGNYTTDGTMKCSLKFGSWTFDESFISPRLTGSGLLTEYIPVPEWEVVSADARRHVKKYECCPESYPDVTFTVTFRHASSSWLNMF